MANVQIHCSKNISITEYACRMAVVGRGVNTDYSATSLSRSKGMHRTLPCAPELDVSHYLHP